GAAESDALLELAGDIIGHELGIHFRAFDFPDVDVNLLAGQVLELALDAFDLFALLADDDAGTGREDIHGPSLDGARSAHVRQAGVAQTLVQVTADHHIFI